MTEQSSSDDSERPGRRVECSRCGYERLTFEACPECGTFGGESV